MRHATFLTILVYFILPTLSIAQTTSPRDPQATALAAQCLRATAGTTALADATVQGTAEYIAGSDDETGSFTLEVKGSQESKLALNLSGGQREEIRQAQLGVWIDAQAVKHGMALHNLWVDASSLLPVFSLQAALSDPQIAAVYLGQTAREGVTVDHLQLSRVVPSQTADMTAEIQGLSAMDLYLDATSHLPVAIEFNTHPDNDLGLNIPVEIRFSNYQSANGVNVPFHIQKFIQGTLTVDLVVTSATINSGIADSEFSTVIAGGTA